MLKKYGYFFKLLSAMILMSLCAVAQTPVIISIDPIEGLVNDRITISGTDLDTILGITFGTTDGDINSIISYGGNNFSILIPNVPPGAIDIVLTTPGGISSAYNFTILSPPITAPTISGINPSVSEIDKVITISGVNLVSITEINFGLIPADTSTLEYLGSDISIVVPFTSSTGSYPVVIIAAAGSSDAFPFTISGLNIPQVLSIMPETALVNDIITIRGGNFTSVTGVLFGNTIADFSNYSFINDSSFSIKVPSLPIGSNNISVQSVRGASYSFSFMVGFGIPTIASIAPKTLIAGEKITVTGANFTPGLVVVFNNITTTGIRLISSTELEAIAPNEASVGFITIITPYGSVVGIDTVSVTENPGFRPTITGISLDVKVEPFIYPNPANNHVRIGNLNGPVQFVITNLFGEIVSEGNTESTIDTQEIADGVYILKLNGNGRTKFKKLVIKKE